MKKGKLVVISGPSGVGKDTIVRLFRQKHPDWQEPPSVTTRQPRVGEKDGRDYYFVDKKNFKAKVKAGEFLEWEETTGNFYGTPKAPIVELLTDGQKVIVRKDVRGAISIKKAMPSAVTICLLLDEWEQLEGRFRGRATDSDELVKARLELVKRDLQFKKDFDHLVINPHDHPETALAEVEKIVKA